MQNQLLKTRDAAAETESLQLQLQALQQQNAEAREEAKKSEKEREELRLLQEEKTAELQREKGLLEQHLRKQEEKNAFQEAALGESAALLQQLRLEAEEQKENAARLQLQKEEAVR